MYEGFNIRKLLLPFLALLFVVGIIVAVDLNNKIGADDPTSEEINNPTAEVTEAPEKQYSYTVEVRSEMSDDAVDELHTKINAVYGYFQKNNFAIDDNILFIFHSFYRVEVDRTRIYIDTENYSDFKLMQSIFQYTFSDNLHYGLMYGAMHDIAETNNFEFERATPYSMDEVEEYWQHMYLAYISFQPEIATKDEIEISKYMSVELFEYIKSEYGMEFLYDLMQKSTDPAQVYMVNDILDEWMTKNNPDYVSDRPTAIEVFNQTPEENTIECFSDNFHWVLFTDNTDSMDRYFNGMNESIEDFYYYMNMFYGEITRLEGVFDFDTFDHPLLRFQTYSGEYDNYGGVYKSLKEGIFMTSIFSFSHEYIHFLDDALDTNPPYAGQKEMRAVYFSTKFKLVDDFYNDYFSKSRDYMIQKYGEMYTINPFTETEKYLGREMTYTDYNLLFSDLFVYASLQSGIEIPKLFVTDADNGYPEEYWISMMNYLIKTYGIESVNTIMIEQRLPDGTVKDLTHVIDEWKEYISNFGPENYGKYYE